VTHENDAKVDLDEEEYRQVRGEMVERDAFIRTTYLFSISAVGALSWAVISLYVGNTALTAKLIWWMNYLPALVCIPLLFVMVAQRRDLIRGGAYISVFFEERYGREGWQRRKSRFTKGVKGESNDPILLFYYAVAFGCVLVNRSLGVTLDWGEALLMAFVVACLGRGHWLFAEAAKNYRDECLSEWRCVMNGGVR
jgi:hypothetical protein